MVELKGKPTDRERSDIMDIEKLLIGKKVRIHYDRHIIDTGYECSSSTLNIIEGVIKHVYNEMLVVVYVSQQWVPSLQKGLFSDKTVNVEKTVKTTSLINMRYIVKIDIIDW